MIDRKKLIELLNFNYHFLLEVKKKNDAVTIEENVGFDGTLKEAIEAIEANIAILQVNILQHKLSKKDEQDILKEIARYLRLPVDITDSDFERSLKEEEIKYFASYAAYLEFLEEVDKDLPPTVSSKETMFAEPLFGKLRGKLQTAVRKNDLDFFKAVINTIATDLDLEKEPHKKRELAIGAILSILDKMGSTRDSVGKNAFEEQLKKELTTLGYEENSNQEGSDYQKRFEYKKNFDTYLSEHQDKEIKIPGVKQRRLSEFNLFKKIVPSPSPNKTRFCFFRSWLPGFGSKRHPKLNPQLTSQKPTSSEATPQQNPKSSYGNRE